MFCANCLDDGWNPSFCSSFYYSIAVSLNDFVITQIFFIRQLEVTENNIVAM